jgi:hypothetical protein
MSQPKTAAFEFKNYSASRAALHHNLCPISATSPPCFDVAENEKRRPEQPPFLMFHNRLLA